MKIKTEKNIPDWVGYLEDKFGVRMFGDKWQRWLRWLGESDALGSTPAEPEILNALKFVKEKGKSADEKFNVDVLCYWIKWFRKSQYAERSGYSAGDESKEARFARIKNKIINAQSWTERWDIVCDATKNIYESQEIERWCLEQFPDWREKMEVVNQKIKDQCKKVYWETI